MNEVSCIIPAYNEQKNIGGVLAAVKDHPLIKEVIVIDDCSKDGTGDFVQSLGGNIHLIRHEKNTGKSGAVYDGIKAATGTHLFFLDADLQNVTPQTITQLIEPVTNGFADVTISLRGNTPWPWKMIGLDYISGERVFPKALIKSEIEKIRTITGFGLEVFLNRILIEQQSRICIVDWKSVRSPLKSEKYGFWSGVKGDIRMMKHIFGQVGVFGAGLQIIRMRSLRVKKRQRDPSISIVIPAHNEEAYIGACLQSTLLDIERGVHNAEVIVVNNASTDQTEHVAKSFHGVIVANESQKGLTHARQHGFRLSRGEWIFNVDADVIMRRGLIRRVLDAAIADEKVVCVSGPHIYYDISKIGGLMMWAYWIFAMPAYWVTGYMAQGGNFALKRSALEKIGGFDTSIVFYGEDTNIARRMHAVGKVRFLLSCFSYASARRVEAQGAIKTGLQYIANYASEVVLEKPVTVTYEDYR